jgi:hypothetical protein
MGHTDGASIQVRDLVFVEMFSEVSMASSFFATGMGASLIRSKLVTGETNVETNAR